MTESTKNKYYKLALFVTFIIFLLMLIFVFSSQDGISSNVLSRQILYFIDKNFNIDIGSNMKSVNLIFRKILHFIEFCILSILLYKTANIFNIKSIIKISLSIFFGVFFAISDEVHQIFVAGRTPSVFDVFIDSLGVCLGICLVSFKALLTKRRMKENA